MFLGGPALVQQRQGGADQRQDAQPKNDPALVHGDSSEQAMILPPGDSDVRDHEIS